MNKGAKLISVGALADFKAALIKFGEEAKVGLIEANSAVQRTLNRLQGDVLTHWQQEEKRWGRKMAEAKSELYRAQLQSREERPSAVLERKAFEAAKQKFEHAQQKIQRIRHWTRAIEKEMMLCRGQLQQLDRIIDAELPKVGARLDRMMLSIEKYLKTRAPSSPADLREAAAGEPLPGASKSMASEDAPEMMPDQPHTEEEEQGDNGTKDDSTA